MRDVIEATTVALNTIPDLVLSPSAVGALNTPNTIAERVYSVTMQTENTDKFRDRQPAGHMRYGHTLLISLLCRIRPNNQQESYNIAIDIEETIIQKMLVQADFPPLRVLYDGTRREILDGQEYVLIEIAFSIEQSTVLS